MALYQYKAFTTSGKKKSGTLEALHISEAKEKIREMGLLLAHLVEQRKTSSKQKLSKENLIVFTSQLYQLLSAKIPLYESLLALEEQSRSEPYHPVILGLTDRIKTGSSLSQAMQEYPHSFSSLYRGLIAAGEAVGNLEVALSRLSALLIHQNKMKKQFIAALTYPAMLAVLMVLAVGILIGFVIPAIEMLFEDREVPKFTQIVLSTSRFLRNFGPYLIVGSISAIIFLLRALKKPKYKAKMQKFLLKIPLVSRYVIYSSLARFARTISTLIDGGLPLTSSIVFAQESLQNARLYEIMERVEVKMIEGIPLSQEMSHYKEIPPLFSRMVKIGEESGKLSAMLSQVATLYEDDTERTLTRLVTLSQPILLLLMGVIIGTVLLSILLPLSDFGSSLQP